MALSVARRDTTLLSDRTARSARSDLRCTLTYEDHSMLEGFAKKLKDLLPDAADDMVDKVMGTINDPDHGGLTAMVEKLRANGLSDKVNSWIAQGKENLPVTADQLKSALGADYIAAFAKKVGINASEAADKLAAMLPHAVDAATPDGELPVVKK